MIRDRILLGLVAGLTGNLVKNGVDMVVRPARPGKTGFADVAAGIFVPRGEATSNAGRWLGRAADYGLAAVYGIPTVYLLSYTGSDRHLLKGALMGVLTWGMGLGLARNLGMSSIYPRSAAANLRMLLGHLAGGMVAAQTAVSLGERELFERDGVRHTIPVSFRDEERSGENERTGRVRSIVGRLPRRRRTGTA